MYGLQRRRQSQNFLYSRKLVRKLIGNSSIGKKDLVLDLGAGRGIISDELLPVCKRVMAIELDEDWYDYLRKKYVRNNSIQVIHTDILKFRLPQQPYKVFSNIPFSIEGEIIRKLLHDENPPEDSYLVMRKDFAERIIGSKKTSLLSLQLKPWFSFAVQHSFHQFDFEPAAPMDCVLLRVEKKNRMDIPLIYKDNFFHFINKGFGEGQTLWKNLSMSYPKAIVMKKMQQLSIAKKTKPGELSYQKWLNLYEIFRR